MGLFQCGSYVGGYFKLLREEQGLGAVAEQPRIDTEKIPTGSKPKVASVLRCEEVMVCSNAAFTYKQAATSYELFVAMHPNVEGLVRLVP